MRVCGGKSEFCCCCRCVFLYPQAPHYVKLINLTSSIVKHKRIINKSVIFCALMFKYILSTTKGQTFFSYEKIFFLYFFNLWLFSYTYIYTNIHRDSRTWTYTNSFCCCWLFSYFYITSTSTSHHAMYGKVWIFIKLLWE